jgi:tetratricopeptide (TPR) repeat protein
MMKKKVNYLLLCMVVVVTSIGCQSVRNKLQISDKLSWKRNLTSSGNSPIGPPASHSFRDTGAGDGLRPEQKADVQMAIGRAMEKEGNLDAAQGVYLNVTKMDPSRADAFHRLAILHEMKGEQLQALAYYGEALNRRPNTSDFYCDFGYSLYLRTRWQEAETNLRHAISLRPDNPRAHNNLGLLLARTGRHNEALSEFSQAGCSEAEARSNLAHALMLENRWENAEQQIQAAIALNTASKEAQAKINHMNRLIARARTETCTVASQPLATAIPLESQHDVGQAVFSTQNDVGQTMFSTQDDFAKVDFEFIEWPSAINVSD